MLFTQCFTIYKSLICTVHTAVFISTAAFNNNKAFLYFFIGTNTIHKKPFVYYNTCCVLIIISLVQFFLTVILLKYYSSNLIRKEKYGKEWKNTSMDSQIVQI